jgi:hypothetical protein
MLTAGEPSGHHFFRIVVALRLIFRQRASTKSSPSIGAARHLGSLAARQASGTSYPLQSQAGYPSAARAQHALPQTTRPSGQVTAATAASAPHIAEHVAFSPQITMQPASHLMSQLELSSHVMVLSSPRLILQTAESLHVAVEPAPALRSQLAEPIHEILLPGPPLPLHSADPMHVTSSDPSELPLHFDASSQFSEHAASPQSATQSAPMSQEQIEAVHEQSPEHVGAGLPDALSSSSSPQLATCSASVNDASSPMTLLSLVMMEQATTLE